MQNEFDELDLEVSKFVSGAFSSYDMEVFVPEVKKIKPGGLYVEIGVDKGKSLCTAFLSADEGVKFVGVDIIDCPERVRWIELLDSRDYRITFIRGDSLQVADYWFRPIDVLFIDGEHTYERVSSEIKLWGGFVKPGGTILFHDCDESSPGVVKAVYEAFGNKVEIFSTLKKKVSIARVIK